MRNRESSRTTSFELSVQRGATQRMANRCLCFRLEDDRERTLEQVPDHLRGSDRHERSVLVACVTAQCA